MEALFILVAGLGLYFLPTIVGHNKSNAAAIFLLNLFLGWTFIGWVVALVWASTTEPPRQVAPPNYDFPKPSSPSSVDQIMKLNTLREKGAITDIEYQKEKQRILSR
jgi:hypothetical protein